MRPGSGSPPSAAQGQLRHEPGQVDVDRDRALELAEVVVPTDLLRTHPAEMIGPELDVEEPDPGSIQRVHGGGQRDLGHVGPSVELALRCEQPSDLDPVDAADELAVAPDLEAVRRAEIVQSPVGGTHLGQDPGPLAALLPAGRDHLAERAVEAQLEPTPAHRPLEAPRHVQRLATQHAARVRTPPERRQPLLVPGEDPVPVRGEDPQRLEPAPERDQTLFVEPARIGEDRRPARRQRHRIQDTAQRGSPRRSPETSAA